MCFSLLCETFLDHSVQWYWLATASNCILTGLLPSHSNGFRFTPDILLIETELGGVNRWWWDDQYGFSYPGEVHTIVSINKCEHAHGPCVWRGMRMMNACGSNWTRGCLSQPRSLKLHFSSGISEVPLIGLDSGRGYFDSCAKLEIRFH